MAAVPPAAPGGAPPPPAPICSYSEAYSSLPDPFNNDYAPLLDTFDPENGTAPADLRNTVFDSHDDVPKVFAVFQPAGAIGPPRVRFLHGPFKRRASLIAPSVWDGQWFAFVNDATARSNPNVVEFPAAPFARTAHLNVPNDQDMVLLLNALPAGTHALPPLANGAPNTVNVRCRALCPLPKFLIAEFLDTTLSPKELWHQLVINRLMADNRMDECRILVNWIKAACCTTAPDTSPLQALPGVLASPIIDATLRSFVDQKVRRDLPGLNSATGLTHTVLQQGTAILAAAQQQAQAAQEARDAAKAPKTVEQRFPQTHQLLLQLCEVPTSDQLPPFWLAMAGAAKKELSRVLSDALRNRASALGSSTQAPVVTTEMLQCVNTLEFSSPNKNVMNEGLSIFTIVNTAMTKATAVAKTRVMQFNLQAAGNTAPTASEAAEILTAKMQIPATSTELKMQYKAYSILLDVLLGINHRVSTTCRQTATQLDEQMGEIEGELGTEFNTWIPRFMRHTQVQMNYYFERGMRQGPLAPLPGVYDLIRYIESSAYHTLPGIPTRYLSEIPNPVQPQLPAPNMVGVASTATTGGGPPATTGGGNAGGTTPRAVANLTPDAVLTERFVNWGHPIKELATNNVANPRTADNALELCLHYHLGKACNTGCKRKQSHRPLGDTEAQALTAFLTASSVP